MGAIEALIVVLDPEGRIVLFNRACEELTGYSAAEALGRRVWDFLLVPEEVALVKAVFRRLKAGQFPSQHQNFWVGKDGRRHAIAWSNTTLAGKDGGVRHVIGTGVVNTERIEAERRLREREARLRAILETDTDGIITIDETGTIESFSPAAERQFGYAASEVVGKNVSLLMPSPHRDQHDSFIRRYLETGEKRIIGIGRLVTAERKDGTTFPAELVVGEVRLDSRRLFVAFVRDVTSQARTERQVHRLQADLLQIGRLSVMGEISAALAHELNQPLSAIMSYVDAARQVLGPVKRRGADRAGELLDKALGQTRRAGQIINRLRRFIEKRGHGTQPEDLNAVTEEAAALALVGAADRGVRVGFDFAPDLPPVAMDKIEIQQVVANLVRNAVDALARTAEPRLMIRTGREGPAAVRVSVVDNGPGVEPGVAARLFQPFVTSKPDGMGIGLSLSRAIVEAHGGRISSESAAGGGASFAFTLPLAAAPARKARRRG